MPGRLTAKRQGTEPDAIEGSVEIAIRSSVTAGNFRILIWRPSVPVPAGGFPVLYAFDGDAFFAMLAGHAASLASDAGRAGLAPAMVVAVGYPKGEGTIERRIHDLTPGSDHHDMPERPNGQPWPKLGGGDDLLETIERDVKSLVASRYAVSPAQTLFGHSLGGLMVLHAFASRTGSYSRYVASSPSIWVNGRRIIDDVTTRLSNGPLPRSTTLRLTVGSDEESPSDPGLRPDADPDLRKIWVKNNRMVGNARDLARSIEDNAPPALDFTFEELQGFNHQSVVPVASHRAVECAMGA